MFALITPTALAALTMQSARLRPILLDVRWRLGGPPGVEEYRAGHLPGAVYVDLDRVLAAEPGAGGRHPLPDSARLQRDLRTVGVRQGHPVVVYDDADGSIAARAWWLLRWAGHHQVAVLDGGFQGWLAEGFARTTHIREPEPGNIQLRPGSMPVLNAEETAVLARQGALLDARARSRYIGEVEPVDPRAGHIPGALNAPFTEHLGQDGRWRTPAELAASFAELGVPATGPVGAYCGSGVTASSVVLALEVAGRSEPAALYAGSWSHWSSDPNRPVATGDQPG